MNQCEAIHASDKKGNTSKKLRYPKISGGPLIHKVTQAASNRGTQDLLAMRAPFLGVAFCVTHELLPWPIL